MPLTHWSYLLKEMEWLAADVAQVSSTCEHMDWQAAAWSAATGPSIPCCCRQRWVICCNFHQGVAVTCMSR